MRLFDSKEQVQPPDSLSLDFNPRALVSVRPQAQLSSARHAGAKLDAIYVPTRRRAEHVSGLLASLCSCNVPIYLIPTLDSDLPRDAPESPRVEQLSVQDPEFLEAIGELRCHSNPLFTIDTKLWDLPLKRNYALWHAHKHRSCRILLLDDDIRGLTDASLRAGARALARWTIAGFFVDDFPDTSVIGHVELALGEPAWSFLSGSCLFVRAEAVGPFPPIYNEDWICMVPEIAQGHVVALGLVNQKSYDPFARTTLAAWQEPGEIVADGLFALLAAGRYEERLDSSTWRKLLSLRRLWLKTLGARVNDPRLRTIVDCARARCKDITERDCVGFVSDWEHDRKQWIRSLEELR